MPGCRSGENNEEEVPQIYDWRKEHPDCESAIYDMPKDCGASYAYATLSAMNDHICQAT